MTRKPKTTTTTPALTTVPLPLETSAKPSAVPPAVDPLMRVAAILAEVHSSIEGLKKTVEAVRSGDSAPSAEVLLRLNALVEAANAYATTADLKALHTEMQSLLGGLHGLITNLHNLTGQVLSSTQSADKYAAEVERRTRPVDTHETSPQNEPAPRLGIIGFLRALGRPEVQRGLGRLIQTAERLGAKELAALPATRAPLGLPDRAK